MNLDDAFPAISDLRRRAQRRVPAFVWEYLDSATGDESTHRANAAALDAMRLRPAILRGLPAPDLATGILGRSYAMPVGIAPVGMSGVVWPDGERLLAAAAAEAGIPYCLSTVSASTPEAVGSAARGHGWFQLYPPRDPWIRRDLLSRARGAGFHTLVLTADVPVASRRERQRRSRLTNPMKITPRIAAQAALRPAWTLGILRHGVPRLRTLEPYAARVAPTAGTNMPPTAHLGYLTRGAPDFAYLEALRAEWEGPLVVKGVLDPADVPRLEAAGVDAIWVSNHGGRQFDAAPASLSVLPAVRAATALPVIWDGGVRSGTDVLRAIALGADLVMTGRAVHYGLAAFGAAGARHALHILREGLAADMGQLAIARPAEARDRVIAGTTD
jgi:L-lactate dehydrogenase (cytochrome)